MLFGTTVWGLLRLEGLRGFQWLRALSQAGLCGVGLEYGALALWQKPEGVPGLAWALLWSVGSGMQGFKARVPARGCREPYCNTKPYKVEVPESVRHNTRRPVPKAKPTSVCHVGFDLGVFFVCSFVVGRLEGGAL